MLLQPHQRTKLDDSADDLFYDYPRFVTHVDEGFVLQLTQLYRDRLQPEMHILDLMSSWVSHLPEDLAFERVEGHGMNPAELAKNPRFDDYFIQNLNRDLQLPRADQTFDAVLIAVSVQYLQYPEAIFSEIYRVLKPGGVAIVSFSNRMFFQKAIQAWRESTDAQRLQLVQSYFETVQGFGPPETLVNQGSQSAWLPWLNLAPSDPFYAVIAQRQWPQNND